MKAIPLRRLALVAALVAAGAVATASFGAGSAKACDLFSHCYVTVHVTGAGQANSFKALNRQDCVSDLTTPTGREGETCTYEYPWGWVVDTNAVWYGVDGWSFRRWSGDGFAHPVHCDGEDWATHTYSGTFCQFQVWQNLELRAEFVDSEAPNTTLAGPSGFQRTKTAAFSFASSDWIPSSSTFTCSLDGRPWTTCVSPAGFPNLAEGPHSLGVRAADPSGNTDATPAQATWTVDTVPPQNPSLTSRSHVVGTWSTNPTVELLYGFPYDATSGVQGYSYVWDQHADSIPDAVQDAPSATTGTVSPELSDGFWYFHLRTVDYAGNWSDPVTIGPFLIDRTAPAAPALEGFPRFTRATDFTVGWTASDAGSGIDGYEVRYRAASPDGDFGPFVSWQYGTSLTSATFSGTPGETYCFSARAIDRLANASAWSAERCSTVPLDDAALTPSGRWARVTGSGFYLGTVSRAVAAGATLATQTMSARRFALLVTKCADCGSVDVYFDGRLLGTVDLAAATTERRQLVTLPLAGTGAASGVVTITVRSSGLRVMIDGLAASRT